MALEQGELDHMEDELKSSKDVLLNAHNWQGGLKHARRRPNSQPGIRWAKIGAGFDVEPIV